MFLVICGDPNAIKNKIELGRITRECRDYREEHGNCDWHGRYTIKQYKEAAKRAEEAASKWF